MRKILRALRTAGTWALVTLLVVFAGLMLSPWLSTGSGDAPKEAADTKGAPARYDGGFEVHYIDVGEADSTLFLCDGKAMLIDGGDIGRGQIVIDYLEALGVKKLDYVIGTHPHADHMGGLSEVVEQVKFDKVYSGMAACTLGVFRHFQRSVEKRGGKIEAPKPGATFELGSATVTVLGPQQHYETLNNMSMVVRVDYGQTGFLVEGDAQQDAEADMIQSGLTLRGTVLRVGHHGSNDATGEAYLSAVKPKYAVISCGVGNDFGHPHRRLLELLKKHGVRVYRTDEDGTVVARSDGKSVTFQTGK